MINALATIGAVFLGWFAAAAADRVIRLQGGDPLMWRILAVTLVLEFIIIWGIWT
jgi:hypothetical protein